jgi:hypothetical protein
LALITAGQGGPNLANFVSQSPPMHQSSKLSGVDGGSQRGGSQKKPPTNPNAAAQAMNLIQQTKQGIAQGSFKMKKEDLQLL